MEIQSIGKKMMILGPIVEVGETDEGEEFDASISLDWKSVVFNFPEGKYLVPVHAITDEVLKFRKERL